MRIQCTATHIKLWLSKRDTYQWANKAGAVWPCSTLANKRVFAEFDSGGLLDIAINGNSHTDCDAGEFNAMVSDYLRSRVPENHPAWFVTIGRWSH